MSDITFTLSGTSYEYMLAQDNNGEKQWSIQQLFKQPPSLLKNKIDMTILAAPSLRDSEDSILTTRTISTIKSELATLIAGDTITLAGYDNGTYYVTFDPNATNINAILDDSGKITEYRIALSCWDLYQ